MEKKNLTQMQQQVVDKMSSGSEEQIIIETKYQIKGFLTSLKLWV
jgi:hypothetical protein